MGTLKTTFIIQDLLLVPAVLVVYFICRRLLHRGISLDKVPGPKSTSFLYGNLHELLRRQAGQTEFEWYKEYGPVVRATGAFGGHFLVLSDPKALHHIFQVAGYLYPRQRVRRLVGASSGMTLTNVEGEVHRRQRRILQPGFGSSEIKALMPIFSSCATKLTTKWMDLLNESASDSMVIDLPSWVSRATLDAIGLAAFDYEFGALDNADNALSRGFRNMFKDVFGIPSNEAILIMSLFQYVPSAIAKSFFKNNQSPRLQRLRETARISRNVSETLVAQKKEVSLSGETRSKDVMSLIVKANASENPKAQLTEEEMYAVMRLLIVAGHETTANSLGWTALELSQRPDVQAKLRQEIRTTRLQIQERGGSEFNAQDFESMPYLTAVAKEILRLHPAVPVVHREAGADNVIPLSKPITLTNGEVVNELFIPKGTKITASIAAYNRIPEIFGEDSHAFNPDRWLKSEDTKKDVSVGVYANLFTFSGGNRSCIGWRFAVLEFQTFIVKIFENFELSLAVPPETIRREAWGVMIPTIEGEVDKGCQLPIRIKVAN